MKRSRIALATMLAGTMLAVPSAVAGGDSSEDSSAVQGQRHQRFLLLNTNPRVDGGTVLGFGPIHAKGKDKVLGPRKDRFIFPNGSVLLRHKPSAPGRDRFDQTTCYFKFVERGTWRVTGGTGAYRGASGHGRYRVRGEGVACNENKPPRIFMLRVVATGPLHF
jgi:hypothetical protein